MRNRLIFFVVLLFAAPLVSGEPVPHPVQAELLADVAAVQPGSTFHVGVRLTIQPGWHVYWINPGDSGLPTDVQFKAPAGFKVESLGFPAPVRFDQPGNVVGYGYIDSLLLIATVTTPADLKPGTPLDFSATAKWLVCKEVCLPGKASPELKLPVSESPTPANLSLFRQWLDNLPAPLADRATLSSRMEQATQIVTVKWRDPVSNVQVFTAPGDAWQLRDLKQSGDTKTTEIRFVPQQLDKSVPAVDMPVVLTYDDALGHRQSVQAVVHLGTN